MEQLTQIERCYILRDEAAVSNLERKHFDLAYWQERAEYKKVYGGRGGSIRIDLDGKKAVLRHDGYQDGW